MHFIEDIIKEFRPQFVPKNGLAEVASEIFKQMGTGDKVFLT